MAREKIKKVGKTARKAANKRARIEEFMGLWDGATPYTAEPFTPGRVVLEAETDIVEGRPRVLLRVARCDLASLAFRLSPHQGGPEERELTIGDVVTIEVDGSAGWKGVLF